MVLGAIGDYAAKTVNTLGAIPGVGTPIGAGRLSIGFVLVLISAIGWLLSGCGKWKRCEGFNDKCKKLVKEGLNQMKLGIFEFIPVLGAIVHKNIDNDEINHHGPTYFQSCWGNKRPTISSKQENPLDFNDTNPSPFIEDQSPFD